MSPHEDPHLNYSQGLWFNWFRDGILNSDIDVTGETPIMHYLIDLNILEYDVNGLLKLSSVKKEYSCHEVKNRLLVVLSDLSNTENGFALVYLLSCFSKKKLPSLIKEKIFLIKIIYRAIKSHQTLVIYKLLKNGVISCAHFLMLNKKRLNACAGKSLAKKMHNGFLVTF